MSMVRNSFSERREGYTDKAVVVRFVLYSVIDILNNQVIMNNSFLDVYIYKAYEDALQLIGYTFGLFWNISFFHFYFHICVFESRTKYPNGSPVDLTYTNTIFWEFIIVSIKEWRGRGGGNVKGREGFLTVLHCL